jgi:hypothetical protein|tara:strand:+ start:7529 stop:8860 length:1332 start_codon:yes stop_codon:yes gene_type:complete
MINLKFVEKFFIITIFFSVLFSFFFKSFNQDAYLSNILVLFNVLLFVFLLIPVVVKNNNARLLIVVFLCLRVFLLYFDYYGKDIANVLHSGGDSERFHQFALIISKNLNMMSEISYTKYTDFLGILYWIIGDQRFFSQFLNVVIGMWSIFIFYKILDLFKLKDSKKLFLLALYGFYPQNIIFSSILLREALILFFFIYSMLFFIQWLRSNSRIHIYKTIIFVLLSAVFHPGMLLGLLVYGFVFLFFDVKNNKFQYSFKRKTLFILVVGLAISLISYNTSILTGKFSFLLLEENTGLIDAYQSGSAVEKGGATYLSNFQINSITDLIFLTPLRLIYFIFSPMPNDVRNLGDIAAIVLDSSIFYFLFFIIVRKIKIMYRSVFKILPKVFIILFLIIAVGFAIGTENSGTAMRHRTKIFPILMIVVVFIESMNQDKLSFWNDKTND